MEQKNEDLDHKMNIMCEFILVLNYKWKQVSSFTSQEYCKICLEAFDHSYVLKPPCGHPLHRECAFQLAKCGYLNCPTCKTPFRMQKN